MPPVQAVTYLLSSLSVLAMVIVLGLVAWQLKLGGGLVEKISAWLMERALGVSLLVAIIATGGSLFYSEVAGFTPCKLCWLQRIFMYPLVPILAIAAAIKDKKIAEYGLVLAVIGGVIALYHYLLQVGVVTQNLTCSTVGYSVSCSDNFVKTFGYITIPMMALSAFSLIGVLMVLIGLDGAKRGGRLRKKNSV